MTAGRFGWMAAVAVAAVLSGCGGGGENTVNNSYQSAAAVGAEITTPTTITDTRDGKVYKTVTIGGKRWFAENLNYATKESICYENSPDNCDIYGRLYTWYAAMTACPAGFRLPTGYDWGILANDVGGLATAGAKLKSSEGWNDDGNGTDEYGFAALPSGIGDDGGFSGVGEISFWWSAKEVHTGYALFLLMDYKVNMGGNIRDGKESLLSVRCVED